MSVRHRPEFPRIGMIGPGRLASGLAQALYLAGVSIMAIAGRCPARAHALAHRVGAQACDTPQALLDQCDLVLITVSDSAIADVVASLDWHPDHAAVHVSGATELSAMHHAASQGAQLGGFHPLQSFSDPDTAARALAGSTITIEAEAPLRQRLVTLAEQLGCRVNVLPHGARARYHAAAHYASAFSVALLGDACRLGASWGADERQMLDALLPLLKGTVAALEHQSLKTSVTGPLARGDQETVARHLEALQALDGEMAALYRTLSTRIAAILAE